MWPFGITLKDVCHYEKKRDVEGLVKAIRAAKGHDVVHCAIWAAKTIRSPEPLLAGLTHPQARVREECASALEELKNPRAVPPLVELLKNDDEERVVLRAVVRALGGIGDSGAVDALIPKLNDSYLAYFVAEALCEIGDRRAETPLIGLIENQLARHVVDAECYWAVEGLLRLRSTKGIAAVKRLHREITDIIGRLQGNTIHAERRRELQEYVEKAEQYLSTARQ